MADAETDKAIEILGVREVAETVKKRSGTRPGRRSVKSGSATTVRRGKDIQALEVKRFVEARGEPTMWTDLIRSRLPPASLKNTAEHLGVSVNELSKTLRLPARPLHRRVRNRGKLPP